MPNSVYHSKCVVLSKTCTNAYALISLGNMHMNTVSDNGVFVGEEVKTGNVYYIGCPMSDSRYTERYKYSSGYYPPNGGINMDTSTSGANLYSFGVGGNGSGGSSYVALFITKGRGINTSLPDADKKLVSPTNTEMGIAAGVTAEILVEKMEVCTKNDGKEFTHITGLTLEVLTNNNYAYRDGIIIARSVPINGSGFADSTSNGSVVFTSSGSSNMVISGDNAAAITSNEIAQAMPDSVMAGNDRIVALSCMASTDGNAQWLGYKNGIYKLYNGPTPHYGMPGERVTIKGHEFVCIAYGPFYARLS